MTGGPTVRTAESQQSLLGAPAPASDGELDEYLSRPSTETISSRVAGGDLVVLGAGGKIGWSVCAMARRALDEGAAGQGRVIAVSRFRNPKVTQRFRDSGVETISLDLMDDGALEQLPDAPDVLYLAGMKFGSSDNLPATWAMNAFLPGLVARRYKDSRIVALSTGNVYPLAPVSLGGSVEEDRPEPVGEYAQSCLGRERTLAFFSGAAGTRISIIRLNYANALRYGVLVDIGLQVLNRVPIDLRMGCVNVIWQGDANNAILRAFDNCATPPFLMNLSGPETASIRRLARRFAELFGTDPPEFVGTEAETALLSNSARSQWLFGYPTVPIDQLVAWTASWLASGRSLLGKPTSFQVRDGRF